MKKGLSLLFCLMLLLLCGCEKGIPQGESSDDTSEGTLSSCAHVWDDWFIVREQTCASPGSRTHVCLRCQSEETEEIPPDGIHAYNYASCEAPGVCVVCGAETEPRGHQYTEEDGFVACTVCKKRNPNYAELNITSKNWTEYFDVIYGQDTWPLEGVEGGSWHYANKSMVVLKDKYRYFAGQVSCRAKLTITGYDAIVNFPEKTIIFTGVRKETRVTERTIKLPANIACPYGDEGFVYNDNADEKGILYTSPSHPCYVVERIVPLSFEGKLQGVIMDDGMEPGP